MDALVRMSGYVNSATGSERIGFKRATEKAYLIETSDGVFTWLPSGYAYFLRTANGVYAVMPMWLARKNGFKVEYTSNDEEINHRVHAGNAEYMTLFNPDKSINTDNFIIIK